MKYLIPGEQLAFREKTPAVPQIRAVNKGGIEAQDFPQLLKGITKGFQEELPASEIRWLFHLNSPPTFHWKLLHFF